MKFHIKNTILASSLLLLSITFSACHKEGSGGKAWVNGMVKHHTKAIPNAIVYIKYGASELPSTNVSTYDDHVTADATGHYQINDLYKGNYYLYAVGYDNAIAAPVYGGVALEIKKNKSYELDIPVVE